MKDNKLHLLLCCMLVAGACRGRAQVIPVPAAYQPLTDAQIDQLLSPIALYPDPLIAQILEASTLPTQIVLADRYISGGGDPNQINQQPWDPSVQALAHYPTVLKYLDDNLDWTSQVGQVFVNQQQAEMDSIQRLRAEAYKIGNLKSNSQEVVTDSDNDIEIDPADTSMIYVPEYSSDQVYSTAGSSDSPFVTFGTGVAIGLWLDSDFDWHNHNIHSWNSSHPRPANFWQQPPAQRNWTNTTVRVTNRPPGMPTNQGHLATSNTAVVRHPATFTKSSGQSNALLKPVDTQTKPVVPVNHAEQTAEQKPVAPVPHSDEKPVAPVTHTEQKPVAPVTHTEQKPAEPVTHTEQKPAEPVAHTEQKPVAPVTHTEQKPVAPVTHTEQKPVEPVTHTEQKPVEPVTHTEQKPTQPVTHTEQKPEPQATHTEPKPEAAATHAEQKPAAPAPKAVSHTDAKPTDKPKQ